MPRYSLRNKKKIEAHFDKKILDRIVKSLDECFERSERIELQEATPFQLLDINDVGHSFGLIIFHVISINFDVYNLAFKEFIN